MADFSNIDVQIGCLSDGRWIAATTESPFFCFEGGSEAAVTQLARRALKFYEGVLDANGGVLPEGRPQVQIKRTLTGKDLVAA